MIEVGWGLAILTIAIVVVVLFWRPTANVPGEVRVARARRVFHLQRERLEAKFIRLAGSRSQTPLVQWADCDFNDDVSYVRNRNTGELAAFVAVTVPVERTYERPADKPQSTRNLRVGTAIFRFDKDHWETDGRAILNLNPTEAIRFYHDDLEVVEQEAGSQI